MQDEFVKSYMMLLDLDNTSSKKIFELLKSDDDVVDLAEFVHGCITMRGNVKMVDMLTLQQEVRQVLRIVKRPERHAVASHQLGQWTPPYSPMAPSRDPVCGERAFLSHIASPVPVDRVPILSETSPETTPTSGRGLPTLQEGVMQNGQ